MSDSLTGVTTTNTAGDLESVTYTNVSDPANIPTKVAGNSDPKLYTEDDINKARQQEKDKLYKRLETMQETVARLESESKQRAEAEEAKQREIQEIEEKAAQETKRLAESEMSAKELLIEKEKEWQMRLDLLGEQVEQEKALRERESQFTELLGYRQQILAQYSDRVAPQLLDLIEGNTPEEINASAEDMAARTADILAQTQEAMQNARKQTPTSRVTVPASGENSGSTRMLSPDEIRSMSMQDYAKHRAALLGRGTDGGKARGLFG